ncbi:hypothetical protein LTR17_020774 [Elasticomyces elasticus]|nr:hypothetical protein LTR17_020774 [Elasticomyces elasticus]
MAQLAEENAELRKALESSPSTFDSRSSTERAEQHVTEYMPASSAVATRQEPPTPITEDITAHATKFHGPPSVLYDKSHPIGNNEPNTSSQFLGQWKSHLFAEASRQRQLETIDPKSRNSNFGDLDPETGMQLLNAFWNRQHCSGPIVYRPAFTRDMSCGGLNFSPLLLNAILFATAEHSPNDAGRCSTVDGCAGGTSFRKNVEAILYQPDTQALCKSRVTTIQALLLMSDALFRWCDERSLSWHYMGIAINMIIDLGIHTTRSRFYKSGSLEDQEIGRRVFWAAYVSDKYQAVYQGRPARLQDIDCQVPIVFLDQYDELEPFNTLTYSATPRLTSSPTYSISIFEQLCKLSVITNKILSALYVEQCTTTNPVVLMESANRLHIELERWQGDLPDHLNIRSADASDSDTLPHTLSLATMHYALIILLNRPFVSDGHLQGLSNSSATVAFTACATAAAEIDSILRLYKRDFCLKSCPYPISYATYVSGTIHVRIAARKPAGSRAHASLELCLQILKEQQERCHAPRQSMAILLELMRKLEVNVGQKFVAMVSRSDVHQGPASSVSPTRAVWTDTQTLESSVPYFALEDHDMDFDIDEIMRSFDMAQPDAAPNLHVTGYPNSTAARTTNAYDDPKTGVEATQWDSSCDEFPNFHSRASFFDPLFGIEDAFFDDVVSQ